MTSSRGSTVSMLALGGLLAAAERLGLHVAQTLEACGFSPAMIAEPDRRVPQTTFYRLLRELAEAGGDRDLGLHLAEHAAPGDFGVLDYLAGNSPTVGECFAQLSRYTHLVHDGIDVKVEREREIARIWYQDSMVPSPVFGQWALATWVVGTREMVGESFSPIEVSFQHATPPNAAEYRRIFRCPIMFGATRTELVLDVALLAKPVMAADPMLLGLIHGHGEELLAKIKQADSLLARVEGAVVALLPGGDVTTEKTAQRLGMSERTLQRRLSAEGATFQSVRDNVRCDLAKQYLADPTLAIDEVAILVAFSETSAFNRAFRRWTGTTPKRFRISTQRDRSG